MGPPTSPELKKKGKRLGRSPHWVLAHRILPAAPHPRKQARGNPISQVGRQAQRSPPGGGGGSALPWAPGDGPRPPKGWGGSRPHLASLDQGIHEAAHGASPGQGCPVHRQEGPQDGAHLLDLPQDWPVQLEEGPEPGVHVEQLGAEGRTAGWHLGPSARPAERLSVSPSAAEFTTRLTGLMPLSAIRGQQAQGPRAPGPQDSTSSLDPSQGSKEGPGDRQHPGGSCRWQQALQPHLLPTPSWWEGRAVPLWGAESAASYQQLSPPPHRLRDPDWASWPARGQRTVGALPAAPAQCGPGGTGRKASVSEAPMSVCPEMAPPSQPLVAQ